MARRKKPPRRYIRPPPEADAPFIEAILAAPDDDAPRLVYADHLLEHGDALHGELITVQCALARMRRDGESTTPSYRAAVERDRELYAVVRDAWTRTFGLKGRQAIWERGFIARLNHTSPSGLRGWPLLSSHPIESIILSDARGGTHYPSLDELGWLFEEARALATLTVGGHEGNFTLARAARLVASGGEPSWRDGDALPHLGLRPWVIALGYAHPTAERYRAVAEADLPSLRRLSLSQNPNLEVAPPDRLLASRAYAALHHLAYWRTTQENAIAVLEGPPADLRTLTLGAPYPVRFDDSVRRALAASPALRTLHEMRVEAVYDGALVTEIAARAPALHSMVMQGTVAESAFDALAASSLPARLQSLEIQAGGDTKPVTTALAYTRFERLTSLSLHGLAIDLALASAPALETLTHLTLRRCAMEPAVREAVLARWPHAHLF